MARFKHPQVVTANHLFSGEVVYLNKKLEWSVNLADAQVADTAENAEALLAIGAKQADLIVGAYLADVQLDDDGIPSPVHFREVFRTKGPSNYFHGKQVEVAV